MTREYLGPHLVLRRSGGNGRDKWIIRDRDRYVSTGCNENQRDEAEAALARFAAGLSKGKQWYVYFVSAKYPDYPVKIGISESYVTRFGSLQQAMPYELEALAICQVTDHLVERDLHRRFAASRLCGEWFSRSPDLMRVISEMDAARNVTRLQAIGFHMDDGRVDNLLCAGGARG